MSSKVESLQAQIAQIEDAIKELQLQKANLIKELDVATKQDEPKATTKKASRVKKSKAVDTMVEKVKGKRDVNKGDAEKIDATKKAAMSVKPAKVQQEKRTAKKAEQAPKKEKQAARKHEGMSYSELRKVVSERKSKLNKADQERMAKAGCRNNTWEGAIASFEWLNKYFAI